MAVLDESRQESTDLDLWYLVPVGIVLVVVIVVIMIVTSIFGSDDGPTATAKASAAAIAKLPPYWVVKDGQTYAQIADKTGLTVDDLETYNPYIDPSTLVPGTRIKLRMHVPPPAPKPLGPKFTVIHRGDSFGSIAAKTGKPIDELVQLNPKLKPADLQPGDRVRLRR
jgi:LysM repeat protein